MGLRPLPPTPESGVICNKCNVGVQPIQIILHQVHKFAFGRETEAKNQLRVIRKAFRTSDAEISNSEWTLALRKSLPRAPNGPPGECKMSSGNPPEAQNELREPLRGPPRTLEGPYHSLRAASESLHPRKPRFSQRKSMIFHAGGGRRR